MTPTDPSIAPPEPRDARPSFIGTAVRAVSEVFHVILVKWRCLLFNSTIFAFHKAVPWSTTFYGRILILHRPVRLGLGRKCRIGDSVYFATSRTSEIVIGDNVTINLGCVFVAMDAITIGENTAIAEYVSVRDQEHRHSEESGVRGQGYNVGPVHIGKNVWIGRGVYIGPGTSIGDNSIVAANSVVRGEFPPGVLLAGAPAIVKKYLFKAPIDA